MQPIPYIGIPADVKSVEAKPFHCVGEKYINAVAHGAKGFPLLIPAIAAGEQLQALDSAFDLREVVSRLDGIFLAGSAANVDPSLYGQRLETPDLPQDPQRDQTTLPLIQLAIELDIPVLAVCRGFQEINVALGGTLHQQVHKVAGYMDHREDPNAPMAEQYDFAHDLHMTTGGLLASIAGTETTRVNSIHGQGIDQLAEGLVVEARAPDGLIEAFRLADDSRFMLGVQWHPEWLFDQIPFYGAIFQAFGDAIRLRQQRKLAG
ncbi:MAG: peptidase C26 [Proteobacteria bacterium]|nr:MAG: peptidase C26 [Pseudomonadota bacterium]